MKAHRVVKCQGSHVSLDNRLTDGGEVVSPTRRLPFTPPGRFLVLIPVRGGVDPRAIVLLEGSGQLKNPMTRDLSACSVVPQPTTLPRAERMGDIIQNNLN
jgi:hypothetical protein